MSERRRSVRHRSFLRGCLYFNKGRSAVDCLIRDISDEGARVVFSDTVSVPDVVDLYVPQKEQTLRARVQWRHGEELGLAFSVAASVAAGGADGAPDSAVLELRVAKLESEVAALRRMLKQLKSELPGGDDAA